MSARDPDPDAGATGPAARDPQRAAPVVDTPTPSPEPETEPDSGEEGFWSAYWERFRRQQVDDPVPEKREGMWDRFRRQDVDDPVRRTR